MNGLTMAAELSDEQPETTGWEFTGAQLALELAQNPLTDDESFLQWVERHAKRYIDAAFEAGRRQGRRDAQKRRIGHDRHDRTGEASTSDKQMNDEQMIVCPTCRDEGRILWFYSRGPNSLPGNQYVGCPDCAKGHAYDVAIEAEMQPTQRFLVVPTELITGAVPQTRIVHRGIKVNARGDVSALCFRRPRAIDMKRACWALLDAAVTCKKCLKAIKNG